MFFFSDDAARLLFFQEDGQITGDAELSLQAMPVFLSQILPAGLIGLIGAGLLAAFMSTHDSYLLCWSSVLVQDVIAPLSGNRLSTRTRLLLSRILIVVTGGFLLVWGLWYELSQDLWDYMVVSGAIYFTGAFAILLLGLYWKRASSLGAYLALLAGLGAVLGLGPVKSAAGLDAWSGAEIGLATAASAVALMILGSLATGLTRRIA